MPCLLDPVVTGGGSSFCALLHGKICLSVAVGRGRSKGYHLGRGLGGENGLVGLTGGDIQIGNDVLIPLGCHIGDKLSYLDHKQKNRKTNRKTD